MSVRKQPALILDGEQVAARRLRVLARKVQSSKRQPGLGIIVATDNPATNTYIERKRIAAEQIGYRVVVKTLSSRATTTAVIDACRQFNRDRLITGYIVQLPLPTGVDVLEIFAAVDPAKDADGLTPSSLGHLYTNRPRILPATPQGILNLLAAYKLSVRGRRVTVIGKGLLTGLPIATLLSQHGATVTTCDRQTKDLAAQARTADILIVAAGSPDLITGRMVKPGAVVIDVGSTKLNKRLHGDVDFKTAARRASAITPVPGGVGPMTVASLLENVWTLGKI